MKNINEYPSINFYDLLFYILQKWKVIISTILIFTIAFCGYGAWSNQKAKTITTESKIESLEFALTNEQITSVRNAAAIINSYKDRYDSQKDYNDNSIYQQLNPYAIDTIKLTYYVDNDYKVVYPVIEENNNVISLVNSYKSVLDESSLYENISKQVDSSIPSKYFSEILSVDIGNQEEGIFDVTIYSYDQESLNKIGNIVKDALNESNERFSEIYGEHKLVLANEINEKTIDYEVATSQEANLEKLITISNAINVEEASFSGTELELLGLLVHEQLDDNTGIPKYIVLGVAFGLIVSIVFYIVKYLLNTDIKTSDDIEKSLKLHILGDFVNSKDVAKKLLIDKKFTLLRNRNRNNNDIEVESNNIAVRINLITERKNISDIAISIGNSIGDVSKEVDLIKSHIADGVNLEVIDDILTNPEALAEAVKNKSVVLFEQYGKTKYSDIYKKLELCEQYQVEPLGIILKD